MGIGGGCNFVISKTEKTKNKDFAIHRYRFLLFILHEFSTRKLFLNTRRTKKAKIYLYIFIVQQM